jgi:hypothetical protein
MGTETTNRARKKLRQRVLILLMIEAAVLAVYVCSKLPSPTSPRADESRIPRPPLVSDAEGLGGGAQLIKDRYIIHFEGRPIDDQTFGRFLAKHGELIFAIDLRNTPITDAGLSHLARASGLMYLSLGNSPSMESMDTQRPRSPITDAGLIHLKACPLRSLSLRDIPITDAGLACLKDLHQLERFYLARTQVKGPGLGVLKSLPNLRTLRLEEDEINERALDYLAGATNVEDLEITCSNVKGQGLGSMKSLPNLTSLTLEEGALDVRAMGYIVGAPKLQYVTLRHLKIDGDRVPFFKTLSQLRNLTLDQCLLLDDDLAEIEKIMPNLRVSQPISGPETNELDRPTGTPP